MNFFEAVRQDRDPWGLRSPKIVKTEVNMIDKPLDPQLNDESDLVPALGPFKGTGLGLVLDGFLAFLKQSGAAEVVGGDKILDQGIHELVMGSLPLIGELVAAEQQQVPLADAVYDPDNWPHIAQVHGFVTNMLTMKVPAELVPWARRLAQMVPPPEVAVVRHTLVATAVQDPNPMARVLSRFLVFEAVCLVQRLALLRAQSSRASKVRTLHLEALGGRRRDVEIVAEAELRILDTVEVYQSEVLSQDDPLFLLQLCGLVSLNEHIDALKAALATITEEINERLESRRRLLEIADRLDPKDRIVLLNGTAGTFGEERVAPQQLRRLNPGHLDGLSDEAIWQRRSRLPAKVRALGLDEDGYPEPQEDTTSAKSTTFADLILQAADGQETDR